MRASIEYNGRPFTSAAESGLFGSMTEEEFRKTGGTALQRSLVEIAKDNEGIVRFVGAVSEFMSMGNQLLMAGISTGMMLVINEILVGRLRLENLDVPNVEDVMKEVQEVLRGKV